MCMPLPGGLRDQVGSGLEEDLAGLTVEQPTRDPNWVTSVRITPPMSLYDPPDAIDLSSGSNLSGGTVVAKPTQTIRPDSPRPALLIVQRSIARHTPPVLDRAVVKNYDPGSSPTHVRPRLLSPEVLTACAQMMGLGFPPDRTVQPCVGLVLMSSPL